MKIGLSNPNLINTRTYRQDILCHTEITEITESAFGTGCAQEAKRKFL